MTGRAWVGDFVSVRHRGRYETEGVTANIYVCNSLLDFGHMTRNAVVTGTSGLVMRVFFHRRRMRAVR